ncbi:MAG: glutathione peroxidase [Fimbriiglobus sp.]
MRYLFAVLCGLAFVMSTHAEDKEPKMTGPLQYKLKDINDKEVDLAQYKGKVVLLVNVASECGYTKQYKGLQELHEKHGKDGVVVIGIPSNEFGGQEPGTNADIKKFCETNYKVTFPMMAKVVVKGAGKVDLFKFLTEKDTNPKCPGEIGWNFEKFLIGKDGQVVSRYKSSVDPMSETLITAIKAELAK